MRWFIEGSQLSDVLDVDVVTQWFVHAGHRPGILSAAADAVLYDIGADPTTIPERLKLAVEEEERAVDEAQMRVVRSLTALQSAVLREMASSGTGYAPFEQATMDRYQVTLHQIAPSSTVVPNDTNVQSTLAFLQKTWARLACGPRRVCAGGFTVGDTDATRRHDSVVSG